jgi:hypothetical protein
MKTSSGSAGLEERSDICLIYYKTGCHCAPVRLGKIVIGSEILIYIGMCDEAKIRPLERRTVELDILGLRVCGGGIQRDLGTHSRARSARHHCISVESAR